MAVKSNAKLRAATIDYAARASQFAAAFVGGLEHVEEAQQALATAHKSRLQLVVDACAGINAPVTPAAWDADYAKPVQAALAASTVNGKPRYSGMSLTTALSTLKTTVMGLTHGHAPTESDTTVNKYAQRVRPLLAAAAITATGGRANNGKVDNPQAGDKAKGEGKAKERRLAAATLAEGMPEGFDRLLLILCSKRFGDDAFEGLQELTNELLESE